jgi:murein L,D-transpeptidase YcbB/YkuD
MNRILGISFSFLIIFIISLSSGCTPTPRTFGRLSPPNTENRDALRVYHSAPTYTRLLKEPWPMIHLAQLPFKEGMRSSEVPIIRQRLIWLGDLNQETTSHGDIYDAPMTQAIRQFQWRHGLKSDW